MHGEKREGGDEKYAGYELLDGYSQHFNFPLHSHFIPILLTQFIHHRST